MSYRRRYNRRREYQKNRYRNSKDYKIRVTSYIIAVVILVIAGLVRNDSNRENISNDQAAVENQPTFANDEASKSNADTNPSTIPDYDGEDYYIINDNRPNFTEYDYEHIKGENYSKLDKLGRCGVAYANLTRSMMPADDRGEIGHVKPSGWVQNKYEGIVDSNPPFLYNRSHLIAYALTGQNDNELNLITGTRYFNAETMLNYELKVMKYLDKSDNHVLYRVTPLFRGNELLARGVEMEAYSIEDEGKGVCFHVFVYNHQPGIVLDYATGENWENTTK